MSTAAAPPLELGATPTYLSRTADWVAGDRPGEGTLTIVVTPRRPKDAGPEADVYAVEEVPGVGQAGRAFLLVNAFDATQPDAYETFVGRRGLRLCTCDAGRAKRAECKHVAALARLVAEGRL